MRNQPILDKIFEADVFQVDKASDGGFSITECCDCYYDVTLTKAELLQLAAELIELANKE